MPLVAELAPAGLRGRYMASAGFSWWIGTAIAPAMGGRETIPTLYWRGLNKRITATMRRGPGS